MLSLMLHIQLEVEKVKTSKKTKKGSTARKKLESSDAMEQSRAEIPKGI